MPLYAYLISSDPPAAVQTLFILSYRQKCPWYTSKSSRLHVGPIRHLLRPSSSPFLPQFFSNSSWPWTVAWGGSEPPRRRAPVSTAAPCSSRAGAMRPLLFHRRATARAPDCTPSGIREKGREIQRSRKPGCWWMAMASA